MLSWGTLLLKKQNTCMHALQTAISIVLFLHGCTPCPPPDPQILVLIIFQIYVLFYVHAH